MNELKTVARFGDPMLASISKGMLEANGIKAEIFGETLPYPSFNAVELDIELKVDAADYESALSILAASDKAE